MLIDTHCHVHFNAYKDDMDEVVKRTLEKGVRMITVGTQITTSGKGLELAEKYDGLWATVGLHPNHLCKQEFWDEDELPPEDQATPKIKTRCETFDHQAFLKLALHPKCVAVGEFGLDYYRIPEDQDREEVIAKQKETCWQHIELAQEANLPVIIHARDSHDEQQELFLKAIEQNKLQRRGVIHCFTGTLKEAQTYIDMGFMISFTGIITFPPKKKDSVDSEGLSELQQVVRDLPLEHLMVETDAPYLTPIPRRGKRNEPWMVVHVAEKIAEIKKIDVEDVIEVTGKNAERLFGIDLK